MGGIGYYLKKENPLEITGYYWEKKFIVCHTSVSVFASNGAKHIGIGLEKNTSLKLTARLLRFCRSSLFCLENNGTIESY